VLSVQLFQCESELNSFIFIHWELTHPPFILGRERERERERLWLTKLLSDLNLCVNSDNLWDCLDIPLFGLLISANQSRR
jgi:hypothetical protein